MDARTCVGTRVQACTHGKTYVCKAQQQSGSRAAGQAGGLAAARGRTIERAGARARGRAAGRTKPHAQTATGARMRDARSQVGSRSPLRDPDHRDYTSMLHSTGPANNNEAPPVS